MTIGVFIARVLYVLLQIAKYLSIFLSPILGLYMLVSGGMFLISFVLLLLGEMPFSYILLPVILLLIPVVIGLIITVIEEVLEAIAFGPKETKDNPKEL